MRWSTRRLLLGCLLLSLLVPGGAAAARGRVWTPEALLATREVGEPDLSPDGRWLAYTVTEALVGPWQSEYRTQVWIGAVDGSRTYQLTRGEDSCFAPAFSPDGRVVAFLSARGDDSAVNLWLIPPDGGEAWRLTDLDSDVEAFRWSPDGRHIAYLAVDSASEAESEAADAREDPIVVDSHYHYQHLWRVGLGQPERDLPQPVRLTSGELEVTDFVWAPDGRRLLVSHQPTPEAASWSDSDLSWVAADGSGLTPLVRDSGIDAGARISPDGGTVAFVSDRGNRSWARDWRICLVPSDGGEVVVLPRTYDSMPGEEIDAGLVGWAADGSGVYYAEVMETSTHLFFAPVDGGPYRQVTAGPGERYGFRLGVGGQQVVFVGQDLTEPPEVWMAPLTAGEARRVTAVNTPPPPLPFSVSEEIRWQSSDGLTIEGLLHYPLGYRPGVRYPTLVELHGGPTWAFVRSYTGGTFSKVQMFTAAGFAVLQVNPRGSAGYGKEFRFANLGDWGGGDLADVLAGVDRVVQMGIADPARLGVFGWSYGGFLTGMLITKSDRFQAAMVGSGPSDPISMTGTSDVPAFIPSFMGSEFWQNPALWIDRAAVFHADRIKTPTLILHGEEDQRVPVSQAYELYQALKRVGVESELVVYPRSGHGIDEPKLALDADRRTLEWFQRFLSGAAGGQ